MSDSVQNSLAKQGLGKASVLIDYFKKKEAGTGENSLFWRIVDTDLVNGCHGPAAKNGFAYAQLLA